MNSEVAAATVPESIPFEFRGTAMEYFGIWIVNILLIILTLGIYTAWAKVRTNRYFYGSTHVEDNSFDYLADPIAILKGWAIAVLFFIVYNVVAEFYPAASLAFILVFFALLPLIIVRAMAFRARNTTYRNIRFNFEGRYWEAFKVFVLWLSLVIVSLGLLYPYVVYLQKRFLVAKSGYGTSDFEFTATASDFYVIYLIAFGFVILMGVAITVVGMIAGVAGAAMGGFDPAAVAEAEQLPTAVIVTQLIIMIPSMLMYMYLFGYIQAKTGNIIWNNVYIQGHGFESTMEPGKLAWIYFTNALAIVFSLGLLVPWAKVRMVRYRLENLKLKPSGDINEFVQREQKATSALGEEVGDVFDVDIGL